MVLNDPVDEQGLIEAIISGANYHRASLSLLGRWASTGIGLIEARDRLVTAFECVFPGDRDQRWHDRFGEIDKLISYVYGNAADKRDERIAFEIGGNGDDGAPPDDEINEDALRARLSLDYWVKREIRLRDRLLGNLLSTTTRMLLGRRYRSGEDQSGPRHRFCRSAGGGYLYWTGTAEPHRMLYVDGEMSVLLMRDRIEDAIRRAGCRPAGVFVLNTEDFSEMPPLSDRLGRLAIDKIIAALGGVDLIVFDNVQALLAGDMELPWKNVLEWVRDLTRRKIAQIWIHHTGHDTTRSYGTKTRDWQMDVVALLEAIERPEADLAFALKFTKARERTPRNRDDFAPMIITLTGDRWAFEARGGAGSSKPRHIDRALELLRDAITREGVTPPAN